MTYIRRMDGSTDGKTNERTDVRTDGRTDGGTDGRTDRHIEGRTEERTEGRTEWRTRRMDWSTDGKTNERTDGRTDGRDGRTYWRKDERTEGRTDGHIDGFFFWFSVVGSDVNDITGQFVIGGSPPSLNIIFSILFILTYPASPHPHRPSIFSSPSTQQLFIITNPTSLHHHHATCHHRMKTSPRNIDACSVILLQLPRRRTRPVLRIRSMMVRRINLLYLNFVSEVWTFVILTVQSVQRWTDRPIPPKLSSDVRTRLPSSVTIRVATLHFWPLTLSNMRTKPCFPIFPYDHMGIFSGQRGRPWLFLPKYTPVALSRFHKQDLVNAYDSAGPSSTHTMSLYNSFVILYYIFTFCTTFCGTVTVVIIFIIQQHLQGCCKFLIDSTTSS